MMYIDSYEQTELAAENLNDLVGILISDIEDQINQYNDSPFDVCPLTATWSSIGYMGCCPDPAMQHQQQPPKARADVAL